MLILQKNVLRKKVKASLEASRSQVFARRKYWRLRLTEAQCDLVYEKMSI